jgi:glycosyltransferase involved in cell wall biosynthesis/GT2 family glycosyltransferase
MSAVSVVIPVLDGERYLGELLEALRREGPDEVLVIDSGSRDRSVEIARAGGADVLEIPATDFGHGRTRNLGAERTRGDLIAFLTQDATPAPGWLAAYREAFALADRVGAAYGPHLPRPDTSPMIARELTEFFAGFAPDGRPTVQGAGDPAFLSNVNACYARACWEEIRFQDIPYAEDQAFGTDLLAAGWKKVYHPGAAVMHAHDYGPVDFMRRYFDEYRGLRDTIGHVETWGVRSTLRHVRRQVAADRRYVREQGGDGRALARWTARSTMHHTGRSVGSTLGSHHGRLPGFAARRLSLERRGSAIPAEGRVGGVSVTPGKRNPYELVARVAHEGPAPLRPAARGMAERERLHVATIVPPFRRGSGGHYIVFRIVAELEAMGHTCSIWLYDPDGRQDNEWPAVVRGAIRDFFAPVQAPVFKGLSQWYGADVVLATGWQTAYPAVSLPDCGVRVYMVNDHEPEFYATSIDRAWATASYDLGMHCIASSRWLQDTLKSRYGIDSDGFDFAIDREIYHPRPVARRRDSVAVYGRDATPRRAVPLAMLGLEELRRRRPDVRVVGFGDPDPFPASFEYEHLGVATPEQLSWLYSEATVGLCLSMTNFSLMPQEMMACGLPVVELAGVSAEKVFDGESPFELAAFDYVAIADAIERLLDDEERWAERSRRGIELVAHRTWERSARQVEAGIRNALRAREAQA